MEEFKYLGVKSEEKGERGSDKWIGAMSAVMHMLYWSLVVKRDLNNYKYAMVLILLVDNDVYCLAILAQSPELGLPFPTCRGHLQAIKQQRAVQYLRCALASTLC